MFSFLKGAISPLMEALIECDSPHAVLMLVAQHPDLLSDEMDALLQQFIHQARAQGNAEGDEMAQYVSERHATLRQLREMMRETGMSPEAVRQALRSGQQTTSNTPSQAIPPALVADIQRALAATDRLRMDRSAQALNAAVQAWQTILARSDIAPYPEIAVRVRVEFAQTLLRRYWAFGQVRDLEEVIRICQQVLAEIPIDSPNRPRSLNNLGNALMNRFRLHGQVADLKKSIAVYQQALDETRIGSPERPMYLNNLGSALSDHFRLHGQVADLEKAITVHQQALKEIPQSSPNRPMYLNNLGNALRDRFSLRGQVADLEEAIRVYQQALDQTPIASPERASRLNNLGIALRTRFRLHEQVADLEEAIKVYQQALKESPIGSPDRPMYLNNLGNALSDRFSQHQQVADLEEAIKVYQQALINSPIGSPDRPRYLNNLGSALRGRFSLHGQVTDLECAIKSYQQALEIIKKIEDSQPFYIHENIDKKESLSNLASSYSQRYNRTGSLDDLDQAIALYEEAIR